MANLKNITDLPVVESAEGLNLIVNDNGSAKQIAASAVGAQADWTETDENSPAFVKNKPVEEFDIDISVTQSLDSEGSTSFEYVVNGNISFEEIKNKIVNGLSLNNKATFATFMFSDATVPVYSSACDIYCVYFPADAKGENSPEFIGFTIYGINGELNLMLYPDGTIEKD